MGYCISSFLAEPDHWQQTSPVTLVAKGDLFRDLNSRFVDKLE
jgi:hypothetical protein